MYPDAPKIGEWSVSSEQRSFKNPKNAFAGPGGMDPDNPFYRTFPIPKGLPSHSTAPEDHHLEDSVFRDTSIFGGFPLQAVGGAGQRLLRQQTQLKVQPPSASVAPAHSFRVRHQAVPGKGLVLRESRSAPAQALFKHPALGSEGGVFNTTNAFDILKKKQTVPRMGADCEQPTPLITAKLNQNELSALSSHRGGSAVPKLELGPQSLVGSQPVPADPSFLPLELFDDEESFETLNPKAWLPAEAAKGVADSLLPAAAPAEGASRWFFPDGSWVWRPCRVLAYNKPSGRFLVQWSHLSKRKLVGRLNLRFDGEDPCAFQKRLEYALAERDQTERRMRFQLQLQGAQQAAALGKPVSMPTEMIGAIVGRAGADELVRDALFPAELRELLLGLAYEVQGNYGDLVDAMHMDSLMAFYSTAGMRPDLPFELPAAPPTPTALRTALAARQAGEQAGLRERCGLPALSEGGGEQEGAGAEAEVEAEVEAETEADAASSEMYGLSRDPLAPCFSEGHGMVVSTAFVRQQLSVEDRLPRANPHIAAAMAVVQAETLRLKAVWPLCSAQPTPLPTGAYRWALQAQGRAEAFEEARAGVVPEQERELVLRRGLLAPRSLAAFRENHALRLRQLLTVACSESARGMYDALLDAFDADCYERLEGGDEVAQLHHYPSFQHTLTSGSRWRSCTTRSFQHTLTSGSRWRSCSGRRSTRQWPAASTARAC
jgi:hypothetical protein